ncbi:MAG: carbohydrate ABC transporter permease [Caldilineaceae bacterium]
MLSPTQKAVQPTPTMHLRKHTRRILTEFMTHIVLIVAAVTFAIPFLWMLSTSLKPDAQIFVLPPQWIPKPFMWSNYPSALTYIPYFLYFRNTLYIAIFNVIATLISCTLVAYGFARINWPGRGVFFSILLATLMIPYPVTLIPTFLIFRNLGWVGTPNPLTWPAFFGNAFFIFLLRQFYMTIPQELSQAAKIDGANEFAIYWRIILPLARPALATIALFTFLSNWNDFLGPLIYLSDKQQYTLALGLYGFAGARRTEWGLLMAAGAVTITPIILLFFLAQRTFIQGITLTGTKG